MEFLVRIEISLPADLTDDARSALVAAESARGRELMEAGLLRRIWRVPGRRANVSLYAADDATAVHDALTSLPMWPWMSITVEPLAVHPLEA